MAVEGSRGRLPARAAVLALVGCAVLFLMAPSVVVDDTPVTSAGRAIRGPGHEDAALATSSASSVSGAAGSCKPRYSSVRCVDDGAATFVGSTLEYGFPIYNRSCVYRDLTFDKANAQFVFHAPANRPAPQLPAVTLSPRGFDLPIMAWKRRKAKRKMMKFHDWRPAVARAPIPCDYPDADGAVWTYYSPIVAPWNYAHTLLCDLFGLFWAAWELGFRRPGELASIRVVAVGRHYASDFPLPNKNAAFSLFSRVPPSYEGGVPERRVIRQLIVGSGTKSWSWVTGRYAAAGSSELWWAFRRHVIDVVGATERPPREDGGGSTAGDDSNGSGGVWPRWRPAPRNGTTLRVSICHKKDKRGVVNYDEAVEFLAADFPQARFVLESAVGRTPREQVQIMLDADVYLCNEGTLATSFFLMQPGSAFISLPLVYHAPHLHQVSRGPFAWSPPTQWWREPDKLRPDPRKNTGGNIDWFPPAIPWVRVSWYDKVPLNETRIQLPLRGLRNYQPEFNIVLQRRRLRPLVEAALAHVAGAGAVPDSPNYSVNAGLCRDLLQLTPALVSSFNSARCYYGMSWLCELWTNTHYRWRFFHEKWHLSKGRCGTNRSWPAAVGLADPRETDPERPLEEYLFYTKERLALAYESTDLGPSLKARPEDLQFFPGEPRVDVRGDGDLAQATAATTGDVADASGDGPSAEP